jgi:hypothetical protein
MLTKRFEKSRFKIGILEKSRFKIGIFEMCKKLTTFKNYVNTVNRLSTVHSQSLLTKKVNDFIVLYYLSTLSTLFLFSYKDINKVNKKGKKDEKDVFIFNFVFYRVRGAKC